MQVTVDLANPGKLLQFILPGFLLIMVYKFYEEQKIGKWEGVVLGSIAISSLMNWIFEIVLTTTWINLADIYKQIFLIVSSLILAVVVVKFRDSKAYAFILRIFGGTDGRTIWRALFEAKAPQKVRIRRELHGRPIEIVGYVKYFESPNSNSDRGRLVLYDYQMTWIQSGKEYHSNTNDLLYIDSNDIMLLETIAPAGEHASAHKCWLKRVLAKKGKTQKK